MECDYKLQEINIKNCSYYYFDEKIQLTGFDINSNCTRRKTIGKYFGL